MPFCLRIRGDKVALFAKDPAKPIIFFSGVRGNTAWFSLTAFIDGPDGKAKYGRIVIRHLRRTTTVVQDCTHVFLVSKGRLKKGSLRASLSQA